MKKKIFLIVSLLLLVVGCGCMKKTAKGAVQDYLNQYKNLSANVISDMDDVIDNENLTDTQKEKYRDVLKNNIKI